MIDLFITSAFAADAPAEANPLLTFLPLILLFAVFYFVLIRPQQKRAKQQKNMVASLKVGDEVVTNGGVLGRVVEAKEAFLRLQIASEVVVTVQRHSVGSLMPRGTYSENASEGQHSRPSRHRSSTGQGQRRERDSRSSSSSRGRSGSFDKSRSDRSSSDSPRSDRPRSDSPSSDKANFSGGISRKLDKKSDKPDKKADTPDNQKVDLATQDTQSEQDS